MYNTYVTTFTLHVGCGLWIVSLFVCVCLQDYHLPKPFATEGTEVLWDGRRRRLTATWLWLCNPDLDLWLNIRVRLDNQLLKGDALRANPVHTALFVTVAASSTCLIIREILSCLVIYVHILISSVGATFFKRRWKAGPYISPFSAWHGAT